MIPNWIFIYFGLHSRSFLAIYDEEAITRHLYQFFRTLSIDWFCTKVMFLNKPSNLDMFLPRDSIIKIKVVWSKNIPIIIQLFQILIISNKLYNRLYIYSKYLCYYARYLTSHRIKAFFTRYSCNPRYILDVSAIDNLNGRSIDERCFIAKFLSYRPERSEGIKKEWLKS